MAQTGLEPSTRDRYRLLLRSQVLSRWSGYRLADLTRADVAAWMAQMTAGGLVPATVRTREQVERLAEAAGECGGAVRLLAFTGLRVGESAGLRVRRVDLLRRRPTIAGGVLVRRALIPQRA